ncbi:nucleoplasmin-like protein ANO39 [Xenopus laevis]|uniref:Nucleoplasmin-like protein ANO39 n=1 Tax=Xenopus laevis TaxID=8355 RepID=A0A8J1KS65_XENLA|nr:nucleoplasmin-like protein ANO39 [Xenopus laevis]
MKSLVITLLIFSGFLNENYIKQDYKEYFHIEVKDYNVYSPVCPVTVESDSYVETSNALFVQEKLKPIALLIPEDIKCDGLLCPIPPIERELKRPDLDLSNVTIWDFQSVVPYLQLLMTPTNNKSGIKEELMGLLSPKNLVILLDLLCLYWYHKKSSKKKKEAVSAETESKAETSLIINHQSDEENENEEEPSLIINHQSDEENENEKEPSLIINHESDEENEYEEEPSLIINHESDDENEEEPSDEENEDEEEPSDEENEDEEEPSDEENEDEEVEHIRESTMSGPSDCTYFFPYEHQESKSKKKRFGFNVRKSFCPSPNKTRKNETSYGKERKKFSRLFLNFIRQSFQRDT